MFNEHFIINTACYVHVDLHGWIRNPYVRCQSRIGSGRYTSGGL